MTTSLQNLIETPIDQVGNDLIYTMVKCPSWYPINYTEGGIYDRCFENIKSNVGKTDCHDNDKYDWIQIPTTRSIHTIFLAKPGKEVKKVEYEAKTKYGTVTKWYWTNIIKMNLFLYKSMAQKPMQGFTFGDRKNLLKPLKILDHKWIRKNAGEWEDLEVSSRTNGIKWFCKNCGMTARSQINNPAALFPEKLLTCDEYSIADIIL